MWTFSLSHCCVFNLIFFHPTNVSIENTKKHFNELIKAFPPIRDAMKIPRDRTKGIFVQIKMFFAQKHAVTQMVNNL
jgi:hypothetical protein